jgi:hypothetical protein
MTRTPRLLHRNFLALLCLVVAIPAARAEANSAQGKVYHFTVEGTAYSVTSNLAGVAIAPAGIPSSAANEGKDTFERLMQSLPSRDAAAVIESAAKAVPELGPFIVSAAVRAGIASGMPAAKAGEMMAAAVTRGAISAVPPSQAAAKVLEITESAILAAIQKGLAVTLAAPIVKAIAQGAALGAIQGVDAYGASLPPSRAKSRELVAAKLEIIKNVLIGAGSAIGKRYDGKVEAIQIISAASEGAMLGAKDAKNTAGAPGEQNASALNERDLDPKKIASAAAEGKNIALNTAGLSVEPPATIIVQPGGGNETPRTSITQGVSPSS